MAETFRSATAADADQCGRICFEAFASICDAHNFSRDFPAPEIAAGLLGWMISHPGFYGECPENGGIMPRWLTARSGGIWLKSVAQS